MNSTITNVVKVIIVEDYKLTRVGLKSSLSEFEGIEVTGESETAELGIQKIKDLKPDVVLMDLGLPGINGIEATQKIKEFDQNIKIIVLTSHERDEEVLAALGSGANAYCLKDIEPNTLVNVIKNVKQGAAWLDPNIAEVALKMFPKPESTKVLNAAGITDARAQLTEREMEVLRLLVKGKSNTEIAKDLIVSVHTAKAHVCSILQKLCVDDRVQAAVKAIRENII
ncbi:MAG TPA: response regulator transcription factor [Candidatus Gastranaerophilales bacterium]|nr:response regulator transcription factor [Candidatus Gastranaerophilales bacterium]